jgi:hypothetical protein
MRRKAARVEVMGREKRRASGPMGALRLHSAAVGAPLHRSPGPAQRKGWSVIGANFGKGWSVRGLRFGQPPQVGASLAMLRHNAIGTSQQRQLPIAMALPGK